MKNKIIGIIGGILILISLISPWLTTSSGKVFYGFNFYGISTVFNLFIVVMVILGMLGIVLSLIKNKIAGIFLLVISLIFIGWGFFLKFVLIKSFGIPYIWGKYDADWLGDVVGVFLGIKWGVYLIIIGGVLIFISGLLKIKGEFLYKIFLWIKNKIKAINIKIKIIILVILLIILAIPFIPVGKRWYFDRQWNIDTNYMEGAKIKKDPNVCEKMEIGTRKDYCYIGVAGAMKNIFICDKVLRDYLKNSCYKEVAKAKKDINTCELIKDIADKDDCYTVVAVEHKEPELCEKTTEGGYSILDHRGSCYRDVAIAKQDLSLCEKITQDDINVKGECYRKIAVIKQDPDICYQYKKNFAFSYCYQGVAVAKKDSSICGIIKYSSEKDWCYYYVAKEAKKSDICLKILDNSIKESCYKRTNN